MSGGSAAGGGDELSRRLGTGNAVVLGMGSMIGAGVFAAFAPAAQAAGAGLLLALGIAAVLAYCNAMSSAWLAATHPTSGGTYVFGKERLGEFWGYLAGWGFVVGKVASCAAMAVTAAFYAAPWLGSAGQSAVAAAAVLAITALNYRGIHRSARATAAIVALTFTVLALAILALLAAGSPTTANLRPFPGTDAGGVLQAAGLLFFAFAGYARLATLGEEVRDPVRTIPRAIPLALGLTLVLYAGVAIALLLDQPATAVAASPDPLATAVAGTAWAGLEPVVRAAAALAALGALLALLLGVSRTTLAMARDGHLPRGLAGVHPRFRVPHRAELAVGVVVAVLAAVVDLRHAIGFSSFAVLVYYAIANASALTLPRTGGCIRAWVRPIVAVAGLSGCVVLAAHLPPASVLTGAAVLAAGAAVWVVRARLGR